MIGIELCEEVLESVKSSKDIENFPWDIYLLYGTCLLAMRNHKKAAEMFDIALLRTGADIKVFSGNFSLLETYEAIISIYIKYGLENIAANIVLSVGKIKDHPDPLNFYLRMFHSFKTNEYLEHLLNLILNQSEKTLEGSIKLKDSYMLAINFYLKIKKSKEAYLYKEKFIMVCEKTGNNDGCFDIFMCLARMYIDINTKKVESCISLGRMLVEKRPTKENQYQLNYCDYLYYNSCEDFQSAERYLLMCIQNFPENEDNCEKLIELYLEYSEIYLNKNEPYEARKVLLKAQSLIKSFKSNDILLNISVLERLGIICANQNDSINGLNYFLQAIKILESSRRYTYLTQISLKSKIMGLYRKTNQLTLARNTSEEILSLVKIIGDNIDFKEIGFFYEELGMLYEKIMDIAKAKECYLKSKNILDKLNDQKSLKLV